MTSPHQRCGDVIYFLKLYCRSASFNLLSSNLRLREDSLFEEFAKHLPDHWTEILHTTFLQTITGRKLTITAFNVAFYIQYFPEGSWVDLPPCGFIGIKMFYQRNGQSGYAGFSSAQYNVFRWALHQSFKMLPTTRTNDSNKENKHKNGMI